MLIRIAAVTVAALTLAGCEPGTEVSELEYRSDGVRCRLTWTGPATGWRLQTATVDGAFADTGAVQKLATFMDEKTPSSARAFRVAERDGLRFCRAADGTTVTIDGAGRLDVRSGSGKLVTEQVRVAATSDRSVLSGRLLDDEAVYGLGERLDRFNKRGQRVALYTSDGYNDSSATYMAIPLFTTPRGGGVFVNLYERMVADFGATEKSVWRFEVDKPQIDVYLFAKDRIPAAIEAYTELSGHADEPEDWNRGPLICRYYPDLTRLDGPFVCKFRGMTLRGHGLREMMERHIALGVKPTAVIVEGGGYADLFSKSEKREEFRRMAAYLREKDIKLMIYMRMGSVCSKAAPGFRPGFNVSVALATNGVPAVADTKMIPDRYSKGINPDVGKAKAHEAADITDPAFWDWYVNTVWKDLVEAGVRGVKIDFCEELPEEGENPGGVGVHYKWKDPSVFAGTSVHHAYPTFFISRFYRELSRLTKDRGGFMVLSRGGGIGSQRNPYLWAGDQQRLFEKLDDQLLALLNSGMSGVPFMTYDLAGYQYNGLCAEPDGKIGDTPVVVRRGRKMDAGTEAAVFRRGVEFSVFTTCVQSHGFVRNAYDFDVATREHYRKYMTIHASLSNLLAKVCREASEKGVPPVRPLVWAYPDDPKTWNVADEFLLGDALLVAPSFGRESRKAVYLPEGDWERLEGLEIPVYVNRRSAEAKNLDAFRRAAGSPVRDYAADPAFVARYRDAAIALAKRKSAALGSDLQAKVPVGPRIATGGKFNGHYLWDVGFSVFWAVHAGRGEMPIASTLDNLYRFAEPDGYIGREFHPDGTPTWNPQHPISFNPPMLSWAELELADSACAEEGRLAKVYEPLVRHHRVCARRWRRPDGLYFGCGLGCGMDDLPRWPKGYTPAQRMAGGMILTEASLNPRARDMWKRWLYAQQADHSWNRQAGWIDMSAAMALDARSLAEIARRLGKAEDAAAFTREYESLAETINRLCWDEKTGFYYDVTDKGPILRRHLGALWVLVAKVAPPERARRMAKTLFDPAVFYRPVPLASLEKGDSDYETERLYWRGPAWPNLNYLAVRGLIDYGMRDEAERLARRWYNCCADLFVRTGGVYENVCSEQLDHVKERAFADYAGHGCLTPVALPALFGWQR